VDATVRRVPPLRRELVLDGDVFERDREVHEQEVELFEAPELELVLGELLDVLRRMVRVPDLQSISYLRIQLENHMKKYLRGDDWS
jgi:hypothetical protein